jgi:hypothetical protein
MRLQIGKPRLALYALAPLVLAAILLSSRLVAHQLPILVASLWSGAGIFFLISIGDLFYRVTQTHIKQANLWGPLVLLLGLVLITLNPAWNRIGLHNAKEIFGIQEAFRVSAPYPPDSLAVFQLFLLLPIKLLGFTLFSAYVTYLLPFVTGTFVFYAGLSATFQQVTAKKFLPPILLLLLLSLPSVTETLVQSGAPLIVLSVTLCAVGLLLWTLRKPSVLNVIGLLWVTSLLSVLSSSIFSPSLIFALALIFIAASYFRRAEKEKALAFLAIFVTVLFAQLSSEDFYRSLPSWSLFHPADLREPLQTASEIFRYTTGATTLSPFSFLAFAPITIYLILSSLGRFGLIHLCVGIWFLLLILLGTERTNSLTPDEVSVLLSPALPILLTMLGLTTEKIITSLRQPQRATGVLSALLLVTATCASASVEMVKRLSPATETTTESFLWPEIFVDDLFTVLQENSLSPTDPFQVALFVKQDQSRLQENLRYFFPHAELTISPAQQYLSSPCLTPPRPLPTVVYFSPKICREIRTLYSMHAVHYRRLDIPIDGKSEEIVRILLDTTNEF